MRIGLENSTKVAVFDIFIYCNYSQTGKYFYFDQVSGKSAWDKPATNFKWVKIFDESLGKNYYYHSETGETTWDESVTASIVAIITFYTYNYNLFVQEEDWIEYFDSELKKNYYYNSKTGIYVITLNAK